MTSTTDNTHAAQMALAKSMQPEVVPTTLRDRNWLLELPSAAYRVLDHGLDATHGLPKRNNKYNTSGKAITLHVNQFKVLSWPEELIAQYDIKVTPMSSKTIDMYQVNDGLLKVLWNSKPVMEYKAKFDKVWIWDGKRIAWNKMQQPKNKLGAQEHTVVVDLDKLKGQKKRPNQTADENVWNVTFRQTTHVQMIAIKGFLDGKKDFTNDVFECINFLDHVLRQFPLETYTQVKRSFYTFDENYQITRDEEKIDSTIEFVRGVYASMRLCHKSTPEATGLAVNLDVANGLFWRQEELGTIIVRWMNNNNDGSLVGVNANREDMEYLAHLLQPTYKFPSKPVSPMVKEWDLSTCWKEMVTRFKAIKVHIQWPGNDCPYESESELAKFKEQKPDLFKKFFATKEKRVAARADRLKVHRIKRFCFETRGSSEYAIFEWEGKVVQTGWLQPTNYAKAWAGYSGSTCKTTFFALDKEEVSDGLFVKRSEMNPVKPPRKISVYDYFKERHGRYIDHWWLPPVEVGKVGIWPMSYCYLAKQQKFPFKTSPKQTAGMIKAAVKKPIERVKHINHGLKMLKWDEDKYLNHFGIKIDQEMTLTKARLLVAPNIGFGAKQKASPGTAGRWNIKGVKFWKKNPVPLVSWGVLVVKNCALKEVVTNFFTNFVRCYTSNGGDIPTKMPHILMQGDGDLANAVAALREQTMKAFNQAPQILFFILPDTNSSTYSRIKKSMDCRFGVVSQCLLNPKMQAGEDGYCANVAMKVNAKLGGTTNCVAGKEKDGSHNFFGTVRTMVIGADVSHPSHASPIASMAAISMNADKGCQRFWAACQTNGFRVEMISPQNMEELVLGFFPRWMKDVGGDELPEHIYYFRDGVSEGQYNQVIEQEVKPLKAAILKKYKAKIAFTVIVCSKRHKIRFFPGPKGDRHQNPHPGTLVERDVTHPFENDFYLNSHSAIQGTARPTHYHVIMDEKKIPVNDLHQMIYQQCYTFIRSTTPVSLYPAVYYAHLAASRCRAHEADIKKEDADKKKRSYPLMKLGSGMKDNNVSYEVMRHSMWFV